jgi:hypothetical protein
MIPHPGFGCIITLDSGTVPNIEQYMIIISSFPDYSCPISKRYLLSSNITIFKYSYMLEVPVSKTFLVVC